MEGQSKKIFSIAGALLLGVGIIFFAWKSGSLDTISFAPRTSETKGAGLSLVPNTQNTIKASSVWADSIVPGDLSSSTTDVLAYNLVTNFPAAQLAMGTTTLSAAEIDAQARLLAEKAKLPPSPKYKLGDLNISPDNSDAARSAYAKEAGDIIRAFIGSQKMGDLAIIFQTPDTVADAVRRSELAQNIANYEKLKKGLLAVKTPSKIAPLHLALLQTYSDLQYALTPMAEIFNDPMKGLAALAQYKGSIQNLTEVTSLYLGTAQKSI